MCSPSIPTVQSNPSHFAPGPWPLTPCIARSALRPLPLTPSLHTLPLTLFASPLPLATCVPQYEVMVTAGANQVTGRLHGWLHDTVLHVQQQYPLSCKNNQELLVNGMAVCALGCFVTSKLCLFGCSTSAACLLWPPVVPNSGYPYMCAACPNPFTIMVGISI